ncbi:MAG: hypothetical protein H3C71_02900, partial [Flavobacteriales bacterium]|nr:hypothetical protein [Flavobacteriales bacterium]
MKTKNYEYAMPSFRFLINNCTDIGTGLYIRGEELLNHFINAEKDQTKKDGLIDTLFILLDKRIEIAKTDSKYGNEGFILGKKANYYAIYRKDELEPIY